MQSDIRNDLVYLLRVLESIGKIQLYKGRIDDPIEFFQINDQQAFNASLLLLINIGEHVGRVSEDMKTSYTHIPWQQIKDLRNRVAHNYVGIDRFITFDIILNELPKLKIEFENIIRLELLDGHFDVTEYELARKSEYYSHIDYKNID